MLTFTYVGEHFSLINIIDDHSLSDIISMTTVTKILGLIVNNLTYVFDQGVHAYVSGLHTCFCMHINNNYVCVCVCLYGMHMCLYMYACVTIRCILQ